MKLGGTEKISLCVRGLCARKWAGEVILGCVLAYS